MKTTVEFSGNITNPTLQHLADWIEAVNEFLTDEPVLQTMDEMARQLEYWRSEFCRYDTDPSTHWGDLVTVVTYGEDVILISDQRSKEFIKITKAGKEVSNG